MDLNIFNVYHSIVVTLIDPQIVVSVTSESLLKLALEFFQRDSASL